MRLAKRIGLVWFFALLTLTALGQSISISGIFTKRNTISITFFSHGNIFPAKTTEVPLLPDTSIQTITIPISSRELINTQWIQIYMTEEGDESISIKDISIKDVVNINAHNLRGAIVNHPNSCLLTIEPMGDPDFLTFRNNSCLLLINPHTFYKAQPIGLQLYMCILFCAALLSLTIISYKKNSLQPILISYLLFLLLLPLKISWGNYALGLMAVCCIILLIRSKARSFQWKPNLIIPIVIFLTYLVGILYTADKNGGYRELKTILPLLIFPIIFSITYLKKTTILLLLTFFVRAMMMFCLFSLLSYITITNGGVDWKMAIINSKLYAPFLFLYPSFPHPSFVSIIITMAIPIAMYLRFNKVDNKIGWVELLTCIILVSTVVVLSGARIGLVVIPLSLGIGTLFYLKINRWLKYTAIAIGGCIALLCSLHPSVVKKMDDPIRDNLRATAIAAIKEKPMLGWGTGSMKHLLYSEEIAHKAGLEKPIAEHNHFHNQYLDEIVQFGFVGSLVFFGLFAYLIYLAIKRRDFLLMAYLAIYLPFMFVESPFATVKGIQPMIFWLCFLLSTQQARLGKDEGLKEL